MKSTTAQASARLPLAALHACMQRASQPPNKFKFANAFSLTGVCALDVVVGGRGTSSGASTRRCRMFTWPWRVQMEVRGGAYEDARRGCADRPARVKFAKCILVVIHLSV
jgi:hypothetical protein